MPTINDGKKVILTSGPHPNIIRQTGSLHLNDGDVIEDASGDDRITFTDAGSLVLRDESGNAGITLNTDQSTTFASHITASGNISASGTSHIFGLPTSDPGIVGAIFVTGSFPGVDLGAMTGSAQILMVSQG
jgi:hypothetical protein